MSKNYQSNKPNSNYQGSRSWDRNCHVSGKLAFEAEGIKFHGGRYLDAYDGDYDLIIDLAGIVKTPFIRGESLPSSLESFVAARRTPIITIKWPDMGIIPWELEDWQELVQAIRDSEAQSVFVCCMGGHGRTGTALTIMGEIMDYWDKKTDPVIAARAAYCDNAVESQKQLEYIGYLFKLEVKAQPGKSWGSSYSSGGGSKVITPASSQGYTTGKGKVAPITDVPAAAKEIEDWMQEAGWMV